jgi:DNA-binding transcriptional LysR family regulator
MGAARKLKAQQPTLSCHITELEAQPIVPLFERTGRGVVPTAAALGHCRCRAPHGRGRWQPLRALARALATTGTVRITTSTGRQLLAAAGAGRAATSGSRHRDRAGGEQ